MTVHPRSLAAIGLTATVPVGVYLLGIVGRPLSTVLSVACVLVIVATLYIVFTGNGPDSSDDTRSDTKRSDSSL